MKKLHKTFLIIAMIVIVLNLTSVALAANCNNSGKIEGTDTPCLQNPLGDVTDPTHIYARLIYSFMGITGVLALMMFLVGGFQWMTASGNPEKVKKGQQTLVWAVLGLVVIFSSYAIISTILTTLKF